MLKPAFTKALMQWYRKNARQLPWRETRDPYKIWISEIMLQQTTVNVVIPYYERWMASFPSIQDVANAPLQKILKAWEGLGYYQRAQNIHKCAQIVCREYNGKIPSTAEQLKKLPGFGPYTVGAVLSIAFDKRYPIVDANVRRVAMRHWALEGEATPDKDPAILKFLDRVMPQTKVNIFNQALMELGALICRNRQPLCLVCPVRQDCKAYKKGIQEIIPQPRKSIIKDVPAVIALIEKNGKFFIQKRNSKGLLADLWEFPGGKIENGETPQEAVKREMREELGVEVASTKHFMNVVHFYTQFRVTLKVFNCTLKTYPREDTTHRWIHLRDLVRYPMPSGSVKIAEQLKLTRFK